MPRFLMASPDFYGIEYEINPWMDRRRNAISELACSQWTGLVKTLLSLPDMDIELLKPQPGLPDMAFTANAGLVIDRRFISSRFRHRERQGESPHYEKWFANRGYDIIRLPEDVFFEGEGDAILAGDTWFEGYYYRSDARAHEALSEILNAEVLPLRLVDPLFYHLDTCFRPLGSDSAIIYPGAFDEYALRVLRSRFQKRIEVTEEEAKRFCCNAIVVGDTVVTTTGCHGMSAALRVDGYDVRALDLSEFIKAGGAAKCLVLSM
ncbi:MAG: arginine deiminase-related protein [Armatimonadota bacterium]|nr:arginine deiminase-related protein [Armatimonadota bacterium]